MAEMKRHVGVNSVTGRKCVVAFMQLPDDPGYALIIDSDALPERIHQAIMSVLESGEGQQEKEFAHVLSRRIMPDTGYDMLTTLHNSGYLARVPVEIVTMLPLPNQPVPLPKLIEMMGGSVVKTKPAEVPQAIDESAKFNQHVVNSNANKNDEMLGTATNLLMEAGDLEYEANKKREAAYRMCPQLRPQAPAQVEVKSIETKTTVKPAIAKGKPGRKPSAAKKVAV